MFKLLAVLILATAGLYAQDCYDPNTGQDCGQCYVVGKTCEASNGRCPSATCEWCRKIVRTEFCGTFYLAGACWCFALNNTSVNESCVRNGILARQKHANILTMREVKPNAFDKLLVSLGLQVQRARVGRARDS